MERNHLCNFGRACYEEQFCDPFFEFGTVVEAKMSLKICGHSVRWSETIYAILKEGGFREHSCDILKFGPEVQMCL